MSDLSIRTEKDKHDPDASQQPETNEGAQTRAHTQHGKSMGESPKEDMTPWAFLKYFTTIFSALFVIVFAVFAFLGLDNLADIEERLTRSVQSLAREHVDTELELRRQEWAGLYEDYRTQVTQIIERIEQKLDPFAYLAEQKHDPQEEFADIRTIGVVHDRVTQLFAAGKAPQALKVTEKALEGKLSGSADDFHNLAVELAKHDQNVLAVQVIESGLERFDCAPDLLADAILYNLHLGQKDSCEQWYQKLQQMDKSDYNWRCFVFATKFLETFGRADEASGLYDDFKRLLPYDERAYSGWGQYLYGKGQLDQAVEILEEGIAKCPKAPQSAFLLSQIYEELGKYNEAVRAANAAIRGNVGEQPSVNQSAILWHRAQALDGWLCQQFSERDQAGQLWGQEKEADALLVERAKRCVRDYVTSLSLSDPIRQFLERQPDRIKILENSLRTHGVPEEQISQVMKGADVQARGQGERPASDLMKAFEKLDEIELADGTLLRVGSRIRVRKPTDTYEGPGWTDEMDQLAAEQMTVKEIVVFGDLKVVRVQENNKSWDVRWVEDIVEETEGYRS